MLVPVTPFSGRTSDQLSTSQAPRSFPDGRTLAQVKAVSPSTKWIRYPQMFPLKNATLPPRPTNASIRARISSLQYSSWPTLSIRA